MHKIVVKEPGKAPEVREVPKVNLEVMQEIVNGYVQYIPFPSLPHLDLFCNEEGKLEGLEPNILIADKNGRIVDFIVGTVFVCKSNKRGNSIGLTDEEVEKVMKGLERMDIHDYMRPHYKRSMQEMFG